MNNQILGLLVTIALTFPQVALAEKKVDLRTVYIQNDIPWSEIVILEDQFHETQTRAVLDKDYRQLDGGASIGHLSIWKKDTVYIRKEILGIGTAALKAKIKVDEQIFALESTSEPGTFHLNQELKDAIVNHEGQLRFYLVYQDGSVGQYPVGSGTVKAYGELITFLQSDETKAGN